MASRLAVLPCALCVLVLQTPSVNPTARSEGFVPASAQQDRMMKTVAPAVPQVLAAEAQWQAQRSVRTCTRSLVSQCLFQSQSTRFCVQSRTDTATAARRWTMSFHDLTHVDVQMGLGPVTSQSLLSSSPPKEVLALSSTH